MKVQKWMAACTAALLLAGQAGTVKAAEDTVISLDSSAVAFTKVEQDLDFQEMEPGEERTAVIRLTNTSDSNMDFFISGEIVYNIADTGADAKNAVYDLELHKGDEEIPFFQGVIGSAENKKLSNSSLGLNYLQDDTLISSLKQGESTTIRMKLKLDGDSTENGYMNKSGQIRMNVYTSQAAETPEGNFVTDIIANVLTGDRSDFIIYIVVAVAALAILLVLFKGRKGEK